MRRILLFLLFFTVAASSEAGVYSTISKKLVSSLHIVKGKVIGVNGSQVELNRGFNEGLYKGALVYIYRKEGKIILFNDNQSVELKKGIAYACVDKLFPDSARAHLTGGLEKTKNYLIGLGIIPWGERELIGKPRVGDRFIAGKKVYRVAIIARNPVIFNSLKSVLEKTGRFYVIDPDRLAVAIVDNRINYINEAKSIKKLSESVDADIVILVSSGVKYRTLTCRVYNGYGAVPILSLMEPVDKKSRLVLINNSSISQVPPNSVVASNLRLTPRLTFWQKLLSRVGLYSPYTPSQISSSTYRIAFYKNIGHGTTAFYVGDVNGDGNKEILVAKGSKVDIYTFSDGTFDLKSSFRYGYNIFHLDSARFGKRVLIAISNYTGYGSLDSCIGYIDKHYRFHRIKDTLPYNIRFYNRFDKPVILAQKASLSAPFYGKIYLLSPHTFKVVGELDLPVKPMDLFTFERIGGYIAYLSKSGQLALYSLESGKIIQKSPYSFGGGERPIERYHYQPGPRQSLQEVESKNRVYIPDGIRFFREGSTIYAIGYRNYLSKHLTIHSTGYNAYSVRLLKFDGDRFVSSWSSGDVKGHMVGCGKIGDYIVSVIGLPAGFFDRFILGILEVDRLTAAQMRH